MLDPSFGVKTDLRHTANLKSVIYPLQRMPEIPRIIFIWVVSQTITADSKKKKKKEEEELDR